MYQKCLNDDFINLIHSFWTLLTCVIYNFLLNILSLNINLIPKYFKVPSNQSPAAAADLGEVTKNMATMVCSINNRDECLSCGS